MVDRARSGAAITPIADRARVLAVLIAPMVLASVVPVPPVRSELTADRVLLAVRSELTADRVLLAARSELTADRVLPAVRIAPAHGGARLRARVAPTRETGARDALTRADVSKGPVTVATPGVPRARSAAAGVMRNKTMS